MIPLSEFLGHLVVERDRLKLRISALDATISAVQALENPGSAASENPPPRQNDGRKPPQGRHAAKRKPAGIHRAPKPGIQRRASWDIVLAEKLWKAAVPGPEIARRAKAKSVQAVYNRAARCGWGARQKHKNYESPLNSPAPKPTGSGTRRSIPARVDGPKRICEGCHQSTSTNPCHCGHIHEARG